MTAAKVTARPSKHTNERHGRWFVGVRLAAVLTLLSAAALLAVSIRGVNADATCNVPPINLTSALGDDGASVVLNWEASGECTPDEYAIHRRDMDVTGSRMTKIDSVDGDVLTYTDSTVAAGQTYRYRIRSNDLGSRSGRTEIAIPEATVSEPESEPVSEPQGSSIVPRNEITLISNFNQSGTSIVSTVQAQPFTTGSNMSGYGLNSVELRFQNLVGTSTLSVKVFSTTSNGEPTTEFAALTNPGTLANGTLSFSAPSGTTLQPGTTYAVLVSSGSEGLISGAVERVSSTGEDSGGADGWMIEDKRFWKNSLSDASWTQDTSHFVKITIKGTIIPNDTTAPSLQTATVNGASLVLTYDETLDSGSTPLASAYSVTVGGTSAAPSSVSISGMTVTLALAAAANSGQTVTVTYTVPTGMGATPVQDEAGNAAAALTSRTVTNNTPNSAPTFNAGLPTSVGVAENTASGTNIGSPFTATDVDTGDTLTYWLTGTDASSFSVVSTSGQLRTSAALNYEAKSSYSIIVNVRDSKDANGNADTASDDTHTVTINVSNVNEEPDITSTGSSFTSISKPEGTGPSDPLATYAADDPEDDTLTWTLSGDDAADFTITSAGVLRFRALTDYEDARDHDTNNVYNVTVNVRDSKVNTPGSTNGNADTTVDDSINVVVTITNIDEAGTVTLPGTITAGQAVTATLTDHDGTPSNVTWQWSRSDTAGGTFTPISGATSNPYTPVAVDVGKYLKATASYTDPHGSGKSATSAASSQVAVGNINPSFSSMTATRSVPENSAAGTNVGAVVSATGGDSDPLHYWLTDPPGGTDASSFDIDSGTGQIKTKSGVTYDFESTKKTYSVIVNVRDNKDEAGITDSATDDTITVTINLDNVDEPGTVTITGTESGGETLTASVSDIDGTISNLTWQWQRDGSNISGATSNAYTTVAADVGKILKAIASYTDPQGSGKSANAVTGQIGASNVEPSFSSMTATRSVDENSGSGVNVGAVVSATGGDSDPLRYTLTGTDASSFTIVANSGQIQTTNANYNFESKSSYTVTVNVSDSKDAAGNDDSNSVDDSITVTINLTDVNEQPAITTTQTAISVAENQTSVLTYLATDVDSENNETHDSANTLTWSVETADDGAFFQIGATSGVLTFKAPPNFEDRQDAGGDGVYNVTVTVTDNGIDGARGASNHLSVSKSLAVTVTDVNETPTLTTAPSNALFDENATGVVATYVATDPDATTGTMTWDLSGNDAGDFNITSSVNGTAELTFKSPPDFERPDDTGGNSVYDVTVRVRDNGSPRLEDTQTVSVGVTDLNETPVIAGNAGPSFAEIEFDHTATASELVIGTYSATDDDNADNAGLQTITFDVSGTDAAHFSINSMTGELSFSIEPDFENPADLADSNMMGASDNMYEIVVEADDGAGESNSVGTFPVTVTVTGVNETPEMPAGVPDEDFAEITWDTDTADLDIMTYVPRDEEISTLTQLSWSLAGTDAADFQITEDSTTGHGTLSFRNRPNFEDPSDRVNTAESHTADDNMYEVIVRISDGPNTRDYPMTVTVTNINERPQFTKTLLPRNAREIEYDSPTTVADLSTIPATLANQAYWYPFEARDPEGDDIMWTLTGGDAPDFVIVEDPNIEEPNSDERAVVRWNILPDAENPMGSGEIGTHIYVFIVNASDGVNTSMTEGFILLENVNERPEFTGTVTATVSLDEHDATLDASFQEPPYAFPTIASYTGRDEEGGVTWSLTGADAGDFEIDSGGNVVFKETPSFEDPKDSGGDNVYNFNVVMTDVLSPGTRRTAMQPVTVTVQDIEETGVIQVSNLDPVVGDTITFTLSDPDGGIDTDAVDISWTLRAQESGVWQPISIGGSASTTLTYTVDEDDAGKPLRAEVSYFDRRNADRNFANRKELTSAETSPVEADPLPNVPPRFRSGTSQAIEEGAAGRVLPDRITATDRDGDSLTFGIEAGQDSALFAINASNGQITTVGALDFETAGAQGLLFFTVTLHDGKGLDSNDMVVNDDSIDATTVVSVRVIDVEEEGVVTLSDLEPEAGTPVTATLSDGDGGVTGQSWQWSRSQDGRTGWSPATGSGATSNRYPPTVNDEDSYLRAVVEYTDRRGGGKRAEAITNPVPSENRRPLFPASETGQRTVDENSRAGTNVGAPVAAEDPENDRLTYTLTGSDASSFTITSAGQIRVGTGTTLDFETKSSYSVTVNVHDGKDGTGATSTDIDDTQDVTITVVNVEEPGTITLTSETATIQSRVPVTATLEDDDIPIEATVTWQWSRSRSSTSGWANIAGATSEMFTPDDSDAGNYIRAIASYDDGEDMGKTAVRVSPRVGQPPPVNSAPAFPATERGQRELRENETAGTAVGDPVVATDFNDDTLTYTLSGTDAALFTIDSSTGQIRVAAGAQLDFETKRTLRVTVEVSDGANSLGDLDDDAVDDRQSVTITLTDVNEAPVVTGDATPSFEENSDRAIATYTGTDPERDTLSWSVDNDDDFFITQNGTLYLVSPPDYEDQTSYSVTITATDDDPNLSLSGSLSVTITVTDMEEEGVVALTPLRGWDGTRFDAELSDGDGGETGQTWQWQRSRNRSSWVEITGANSETYTAGADDVGHYLRATVSYTDRRGGNKEASAATQARIGATRPGTNSAPGFTESSTTRSIRQGSGKGRPVGAPVRAMDADEGEILTYELEGTDEEHFTIDPLTGQIRTNDVLVEADQDTYTLDVIVSDGFDASYDADDGEDDRIQVVITVAGGAFVRSGSSGGGGGFGFLSPPPATPSEADFDWNVERDLDELDPENENPTDIWSDGQTIWVLENPTTGPDRLFAYGLVSGERLEDAEFELDARNRFSHGIWSDGTVIWIADSGQDKLFAYRLEDGTRLSVRDIELDERNGDPRGIWSDGRLIYVVDSGQPALFVYRLADGELLAEHELHSLNRSPRGVWSDRFTIWISDDGANRVFAYRIEDDELRRIEAEEFSFRFLLKAGNGDARGIWSDLEVLLVADAQDARLYSYNMPDAIDARLVSLSLSDVEIGPFSPLRTDYVGTTTAALATVEATPAQDGARVEITPVDADDDITNGHQVALSDYAQISVRVTSPDGSRVRVYWVIIEPANRAPVAISLPMLWLVAGSEPGSIDLAAHFTDPDGDTLGFTIGPSSDSAVATVSVTDGVLNVTPIRPGTATVTVTASDGSLSSAPASMTITVLPTVEAHVVRIAARRVANGHFEFALQERSSEGVWQLALLPNLRFFPISTAVGRWLNSSPVNVGGGEAERTIRISARRVNRSHVEFAIQVRAQDGEWGERLLPTARFLRTSVPIERWFVSTPLETSER